MRAVFAAATTLFGLMPAAAQEHHPTVSKAIEIAVAGRVVATKCPGWSINPRVAVLAAMAASFAGQQAELDAVTEEEIQALTAKALNSSLSSPAECAALSSQAMPDPFSEGRTIPLFLHSEK